MICQVESVSPEGEAATFPKRNVLLQAQVKIREARTGNNVASLVTGNAESAERVDEDRSRPECRSVEPAVGAPLISRQVRIHQEVRPVSAVGLGATQSSGKSGGERLPGLQCQDS